MHRVLSFFMLLTSLSLASPMWAQDSGGTATCNYDDDKQLVLQYQHVTINLKKPLSLQIPYGKVWSPAGKPMTLFTNTPIQIGSRNLPIGAYTLFVIPNSKQWTLVVSKSTDVNGSYDEQQDLTRVPMESGELPSPQPEFSVTFAHIAPDQCNIRLDLEKTGHFVVFQKR
jgi:hypothetical protein